MKSLFINLNGAFLVAQQVFVKGVVDDLPTDSFLVGTIFYNFVLFYYDS